MTTAELANENTRLLAWVLRKCLRRMIHTPIWYCTECGNTADAKIDVRHAPGCILFGHDRATLAALEEQS